MSATFAERINSAFNDTAENFGLVGLAWRVKVGDELCNGSMGRCSRAEGDANSILSSTQQWHWGSCAKALTATVIACCIDSGKLRGWSTTIGELRTPVAVISTALGYLSSDLKDTVVGPITLLQLAHHRSGLIADLEKQEEDQLHESVASKPLPEQRLVYLRRVSEKPLHHPPGERYGPYSNAGFVVLATVVEVVTKTPWETLVQDLVIKPLNMTTFGFGIPQGGAIGHDEDELPQPDGKDKPWLHSSFSVHSTLEDWEKFASMHLAVLKDEYKEGKLYAKTASMKQLHSPVSPATPREPWDGSEPPNGYAMGWKTIWVDNGEDDLELPSQPTCLWHFGTNFLFNSGIYIDSERNIVAVVASNSGSMVTRLAIRTALETTISIVSEK